MKQIEITTRILEDLNSVSKKLTDLGFKKIRTSFIDDIYMCPSLNGISKNNISNYLKQSVLIRCLNVGEKTFKKLTYKNKIFNNGMTISEEKINVDINDTDKAKALFLALNFKELVRVKYECIVYEKNGLELAFQDVEGLGLLLEYENINDFEFADDELIKNTKNNMLKEIKALGIKTTDELDVKKAYELIEKKVGL